MQITVHPGLYGVMREILAQNLHSRILMKKMIKGIPLDYTNCAWEKLDKESLEAFYRYADEILNGRYGVGINQSVTPLTEQPESATVKLSASPHHSLCPEQQSMILQGDALALA